MFPRKVFRIENPYIYISGNVFGDLEPFFISWANRVPQESLSVTIINYTSNLRVSGDNMVLIERFKRSGVIKKFEIVKDES